MVYVVSDKKKINDFGDFLSGFSYFWSQHFMYHFVNVCWKSYYVKHKNLFDSDINYKFFLVVRECLRFIFFIVKI